MKYVLLAATLLALSMPQVFAQPGKIEIGKPAPEISLPNLKGDTVKLSAFRGKVVLVDFWATWCAPCVKEQPLLATLYKKYHQSFFTTGQGFEIYGVSLDIKKASLEASIKKLKISWTQVSDLKYWMSPVAALYGIETLPFNVLIDGNGIVIAKNLHGKKLEETIRSFLQKK